MLNLSYTGQFKRDYRREKAGQHADDIDDLLRAITSLLQSGGRMPAAYKDHPLKGQWRGARDCHLKPDLVLIYRKTAEAIELVRLGSHAELFG
ncbi:MAG: type II toxin-antitoxin system YafQ family toxin [Phenylobacterium sp.]|uniref:type II toxin-antitoxin system YafQ family toxin n=1 Tax=Phenylobacterium sp. TaxID=1871053 RepID=UPI002735FA0E|nr:type II toxin-antitoxin system YafQ family toxin [Phenylobacterium sp.]MDP3117959.1 type II toxin-antitoxin system YafQ family toxin [Phenylobacterium sp.]